MKVFNWTNIRLVLMFSLVIFLFSFTSNRNNNRKLTKSVVIFVGDNAPFVDQETVNKLLIENNRELAEGLIAFAVDKDRRALRVNVQDLNWLFVNEDILELTFSLPAGSYATSVLREIIKE